MLLYFCLPRSLHISLLSVICCAVFLLPFVLAVSRPLLQNVFYTNRPTILRLRGRPCPYFRIEVEKSLGAIIFPYFLRIQPEYLQCIGLVEALLKYSLPSSCHSSKGCGFIDETTIVLAKERNPVHSFQAWSRTPLPKRYRVRLILHACMYMLKGGYQFSC